MAKTFKKDNLTVKISDSRVGMGKTAAADAAEALRRLLSEKEEVNVIFAAAPSQNETLAALVKEPGIDWSRVNAFHMDEYIGLAPDAPQRFGKYLYDHVFGLLPFKSVNYIKPDKDDPEATCREYSALLEKYQPDVIMMGIGENGHIAFNDPPVADFNDPKLIKVVKLDEICRNQQVNDGCFASIGEVPTHALSLTIPVFMKAGKLICSVPAPTKAQAVYDTIHNEKCDETCPATCMRGHKDATLYLDPDSAALLGEAE
ncbi:MAG: glucosamine-6-phosphate deaminase [Clostridia bacterium]|nr:glucosamine-6-phosphate deaminase [Clostridia bacterium]